MSFFPSFIEVCVSRSRKTALVLFGKCSTQAILSSSVITGTASACSTRLDTHRRMRRSEYMWAETCVSQIRVGFRRVCHFLARCTVRACAPSTLHKRSVSRDVAIYRRHSIHGSSVPCIERREPPTIFNDSGQSKLCLETAKLIVSEKPTHTEGLPITSKWGRDPGT